MIFKYLCKECNIYMVNNKLSIRKYIKTKHFFMEIIIYTFKQSVAKIFFDGTTVFVSCKT